MKLKWKIGAFSLSVIALLVYCIMMNQTGKPSNLQVNECNNCQPIPMPSDGLRKNDTLTGKAVTDTTFKISGKTLFSKAILGDEYRFNLRGTLITISRSTTDRAEIAEQRNEGNAAARKRGQPTNNMAPLPDRSFMLVKSAERMSIDTFNFEYIKKIRFLNENLYPNQTFEGVYFRIFTKALSFEKINFTKNSTITGTATKLLISNCSLRNFTSTISPYSFELNNVTIDSANSFTVGRTTKLTRLSGAGTLELRVVSISDLHPSDVIIENVNLDNLKFPDYGINFIVTNNESHPYSSQIRLLQQLVNHYSTIPDIKKKYDVQLQERLYLHENRWFSNFIVKNWNNYGYDKNMVFRNSLILMLLFFGINTILFHRLLEGCYEMPRIADAYKKYGNEPTRRKNRAKLFYSLVYTIFVFWGINLKLDKIKLVNKALFFYLIAQYILGIICLGYIANIIITE